MLGIARGRLLKMERSVSGEVEPAMESGVAPRLAAD